MKFNNRFISRIIVRDKKPVVAQFPTEIEKSKELHNFMHRFPNDFQNFEHKSLTFKKVYYFQITVPGKKL